MHAPDCPRIACLGLHAWCPVHGWHFEEAGPPPPPSAAPAAEPPAYEPERDVPAGALSL